MYRIWDFIKRAIGGGITGAIIGFFLGGGIGAVAAPFIPFINEYLYDTWAGEIGQEVADSIGEEVGYALGDAVAGAIVGSIAGAGLGALWGAINRIWYSDF